MKRIINITTLLIFMLCQIAVPPNQAYAETPEEKAGTISLDFKGMDVVDVLKLIAQRGNLNIAISRHVRGKVTMFLKDVDIHDAFEIILVSNDLAYEKSGNILNVMTGKEYEKIYGQSFRDKRVIEIFELKYANSADISKAIALIKTKIGKVIIDESTNTIVIMDSPQMIADAKEIILSLDKPIETRVFTLNYAKAEEVKAKIEEKLTKNVGFVQVDERTNKIIITDLASKMAEAERLINELDERTREVLIEAKILEVTLNDEFKWGINWERILRALSKTANLATGANLLDTFSGEILPAEGGSVIGGAMEIGTLSGHKYHALMQILETVGKTEVLSSPRIVVINNEEASILVGTNQPYATTGTTVSGDTSQTTQQVTYVDLGIKLHVTPTINKDGYITMKIKPEVSSKTGDIDIISEEGTTTRTTQIPIIQTSEAETTVMVKDGNTIVLAGLIEKREVEEESRIPILADLPLIGFAFKSIQRGSDDDPERKELVIFLTPHIISGDTMSPEVNEYLTTTEVGKAERVQPPAKKRMRTHFALFGPKEEPLEERVTKVAARPSREKAVDTKKMSRERYYKFIRYKVLKTARENYPRSGISGDVYISFNVDSDGNLVGSPKIMAAADNSLKSLAIKSVKDASPFPAFPKAISGPVETFSIVISYK
ncbi:MAG: hypothetical protein ISS34_02275 [Candidatus Omnitrophica bacterium]|nr:hypothetical protein [Candidatus Omnitrophota bacterium]